MVKNIFADIWGLYSGLLIISAQQTIWIYCRISLVNETLLNYFFVELRLMDHLKTLRRYLLMENGDFAQILSDMLFEKVSLMESDTLVLKLLGK